MSKSYDIRKELPEEGWERLYSKRKKMREDLLDDDGWDEEKIDLIGQNGSLGDLYEDEI
jgi:hypothetical protein